MSHRSGPRNNRPRGDAQGELLWVRGLVEEDAQLRRTLARITTSHAQELQELKNQLAERDRQLRSLRTQLNYYERTRS